MVGKTFTNEQAQCSSSLRYMAVLGLTLVLEAHGSVSQGCVIVLAPVVHVTLG